MYCVLSIQSHLGFWSGIGIKQIRLEVGTGTAL